MYSFVIPSYQRIPLLRCCIASIERAYDAHPGIEYEIIAVFCEYIFDKTDLPCRYPEKLKTLPCPVNNVSRAKNMGITAASGRWVVLIDDDATLSQDFFRKFEIELAKGPHEAFCARLLDPSTSSCMVATDLAHTRGSLRRIEYSLFRGSALILEKALLQEAGMFNENFGPGGRYFSAEESDLFFRLMMLERPVIYLPDVILYHPSISKIDVARAFSYAYASGALFTKWVLRDPVHTFSYLYLYYFKMAICTIRLVQLWCFPRHMRRRNEKNRYFHVLKGMLCGTVSYLRHRG